MDFVANFDLNTTEFEANFELNDPAQFDALFEINPAGASWGSITGEIDNQTDLKNALDDLQEQITTNHQEIGSLGQTIGTYGDVVTYNASDFATSIQGGLADTALQPGDNISELVNDAGYITSASLPTVNDATITIQKNGSNVESFSLNQSSNETINIIVPTDTSDLTNNAGYTTNIGTVTSVNNVSPDSEGNVTLSIPAAQVNSDWNASSGVAEILNKPNLATVATTGSYTDLINKPTINDLTTTAQQNALNSGATSTNIGQIATNTNDISDIQDLIPTQATSSNQLADKNFVNSSIATNTANFIGTFNSVAELEAYSGTLTNNDYAFVVGTDSDGNTVYDRYKYTTATTPASWVFEYELNNSSFTAAQWDAINSGITSGDVTLIGTALQPNDNISNLVNDSGYITGINSSDVTTALGYTPYNSTNPDGFISGIDSTDVTTALGYTPYNATNPDGYITSSALTDYVTTDTTQNITGTKTFVGQKKVGFKQSSSSDKLGFTLYNNSGTEKGYLEYNPSNTVDSVPLMTLGNYASAAAGLTHVGFRKYSSVTGAAGAYNLLAPLISDAKTPFSLSTTYTNFYLPLGFTDGTTTIKTAKTGLVDLSGLDYVLSSSLATVATSGSYNDLTDKPTIPTVNNATLTITQGGVSKGTFTANAGSDVTIALDAGGGETVDVPNNVLAFDNDAKYIAESQLGDSFAITETSGQPYPYANISGSNFSMQGDVSTSLTKNSTTLQLFTFANGKIDVTKHIVMDFHQRPDDTDSYTYGNYTTTPTFADTPILGKMVNGVFTPKIYITSDTIYEVSAVDSTSYSSGVTTYTLTTDAIGTIAISPSGADLVTVMLKAKNSSSPSWRLQVTANADSSQLTYETIWTSSTSSYDDILDYIDTVIFVENTTGIPIRCVGEWAQALYYTPDPLRTVENMSTIDMISNPLNVQTPLTVETNTSEGITTSSNITYDYSTGLITTAFTETYEEGYIRFEIPDNVNINALTDYWRFGTKTQNIFNYLNGMYANSNVVEITDEDSALVSRVWYGSSAYRKGLSASQANYSVSSNNEIMHHIANATATYQGTGSDNFSQDITIANKKLKYLQIYYVSNGNSNIGVGIFNTGNTNSLSDVRVFTSADDTEGILLEPKIIGKSIKLNYGSGLAVVSNELVVSGKQDTLVSGTNIKTINNTSLLGSGNIDTSEIFVATVGTTNLADITTAYNAGKTIFALEANKTLYSLVDYSSSRVDFAYINGTLSSGVYVNSGGWNTNSVTLQTTSNKVTSISSSSTDTQYPSAKCVYDELTTNYVAKSEVRYDSTTQTLYIGVTE